VGPIGKELSMPKVLIVDDEKHIRMLYAEELEEDGYEVAVAADGSGILERIEKEKPDVIILDIKMVSSNGLDVLQEIRNKFYNLPVILCSAYGSYKVDIKSIAADAYVVKSSDLTELKKKIAQVLETTVPI
jgi:DNA-binding response OmpR family regulator